jgi:hypothetical protein
LRFSGGDHLHELPINVIWQGRIWLLCFSHSIYMYQTKTKPTIPLLFPTFLLPWPHRHRLRNIKWSRKGYLINAIPLSFTWATTSKLSSIGNVTWDWDLSKWWLEQIKIVL